MSEPAPPVDVGELTAIVAASYPQARLVVLFGSVALGKALLTSDADVAVLGLTFWDGLTLGAKLGRALGREPHVVELETASDVLRIEITRSGILIFEGEPNAWVQFRAESIVRWLDIAPMVELCAKGARKRLLEEARRG